MALLTPGSFTYSEWALRHDKDGKVSTLVNMLSQANDILDDMTTAECQSGNIFEYTQVTKLPTPTKRAYNMGVPASLAGVGKLYATAVEYADWSNFDSSLVQLGGDLAQLRTDEDNLHMCGMGQQVAYDLFYANRLTNPLEFTGFSNIYNTVSTATSQIANNVLDMGGTGSTNASLWLVGWGPKAIHTIFPKGLPLGLQHTDVCGSNGPLPIKDAAGNEYLAYRTWLQWNLGLAIHDWRFAARACNIDVSLLNGGSAANIITALTKLVHKMPITPQGIGPVQTLNNNGYGNDDTAMPTRWAFYCNRDILTYLDLQAQNKTNLLLQMEQWGTKSVVTYRGIPIRCVDALLSTESRVV